MTELKPCPFCGGINVTVKQDSCEVCGHRYWFVTHSMPSRECLLTDSFNWWHSRAKFTTKEKAIEAWNRRIADGLMENCVTDNNDGCKWIPVEERLPDHFGVFVVAISEPGKMRVGKDCADFDPFAKTWLPSMCWDRGYKVSHWMPLPEPPKEV